MRFIDEVCNLFDLEVLCDIDEFKSEEHGIIPRPVMCIGSRATQADGTLVEFIMTLRYESLEELDEFCGLHIETFRKIAADEDAPAPNATNWHGPLPKSCLITDRRPMPKWLEESKQEGTC